MTTERSGFFDVTFAPFAVPEKPQLSTGTAAGIINNCAAIPHPEPALPPRAIPKRPHRTEDASESATLFDCEMISGHTDEEPADRLFDHSERTAETRVRSRPTCDLSVLSQFCNRLFSRRKGSGAMALPGFFCEHPCWASENHGSHLQKVGQMLALFPYLR